MLVIATFSLHHSKETIPAGVKELSRCLWIPVIPHQLALSWAFPPVHTKTFLCFQEGGSKSSGIEDGKQQGLHLSMKLQFQPAGVPGYHSPYDLCPKARDAALTSLDFMPYLSFYLSRTLARKTHKPYPKQDFTLQLEMSPHRNFRC